MPIEEQSPSFASRAMATAWFTAANLVLAQFVVVRIASDLSDPQGPVPQEIWVPVMYLVWIQVGLNGVLLLMSPRTRPFGVGIIVGTVGTIVLFFLFLYFFVLPDIS